MSLLRPALRTIASCCLLGGAGILHAATTLRDWRPEDSTQLRYLYDAAGASAAVWSDFGRAEDLIRVSPGGDYFFLGTRQGDMKCDCARYTLWVYSAAQVHRVLTGRLHTGGIEPLHSVQMSTTVPGGFPAIWHAVWEDASTVVFKGYGEGGKHGLYRLDARTGEVRLLFDVPEDNMTLRSYVLRGAAMAYGISHALPAEPLPKHYPTWDLQGLHGSVKEWLDGKIDSPMSAVQIFVHSGTQPAYSVASYLVPRASSTVGRFDLSPDGTSIVVAVPAYKASAQPDEPVVLPSGWDRYEGLNDVDGHLGREGYRRAWKYELLSVSSRGVPRTLVDAPRGPLSMAPSAQTPELFWSADGAHVVLVNTSLPMHEEEPQRRAMGYLVDYDLRAGSWSVLEPMVEGNVAPEGGATVRSAKKVYARKVQDVTWLREGKELLVRYVSANGEPTGGNVYTLNDQGWQSRPIVQSQMPAPSTSLPSSRTTELAGGLKIELRQSVNDPPKLYAREGRREAALLPSDQVLAEAWRAPQQTVQWTEQEGHVESGQLLLPRDRPSSAALPLVVQIEAKSDGQFRPDGASSTAYAAQALVAQGIAVLRLDAELGEDYPQLTQQMDRLGPKLVRERVDKAVAKLTDEGRVDPHRVGVIGFSRPGYFTSYLITHPEGVTPAAAIIADSLIESYGEYIYFAGTNSQSWEQAQQPGGVRQKHKAYGGPFWQNKDTWIAEAPMFNVERVQTPTLFTYNGAETTGGVVPQVLEVLTAYRLADREVDVQLFPEGFHELTRSRQRLASLQLTVDWMNFWLQDRENPDPAKADQNRAWRVLREHRQARLAHTIPPPSEASKEK